MAARSVTAGRFVAIHGHFYQPPRENPWLEAVEVHDSAALYHDWNERVTAECYAPNTAARRVGEDNRILDIVNNFEKISFNIGPTLLSWLERHAPDVYRNILEADAPCDGVQLVHCATDGESYGHHKQFGDMALAAAIAQVEAEGFAVLTDYGAFLAKQPPALEVQIRELTSWSCVHGVERWQSDCGCRTRPDWHQRWRGPLREALDWLRDQIEAFYESHASAFLRSPWEARDAYIDVILDRSPDGLATWLARHRRVLLDAAAQVETRRLLELERDRLLMYTSCGWFFDDMSALEPTQILKYAAMALQYLSDLGGGDLEYEFVRRLEAAPTNVPVLANGGEVYRALIRPAVVDLRRVVAHYPITGLCEKYPDAASVYAWRVQRLDDAGDNYDGSWLRIGRVRIAPEITGESRDLQYTVLHFGGHDFSCGIRTGDDPAAYDTMKADLLRRYAQRSMADTVRGLDEHFPEGLFSLTHLFLEQRRHVLPSVLRAVLEKHEQTYRRVWDDSRKLVRYLRQADAQIPEVLRITAKYVLEEELVAELRRAADAAALPERVFEVSEEAHALGLELDSPAARPIIRLMVGRGLDALAERVTVEWVAPIVTRVLGARRLGVGFGLWHTQNRVFALWRDHPEARDTLRPLVDALGFALAGQATP